MVLLMFDIDGTLTSSYQYDQQVFAEAVSEVAGAPFHDTDWHHYARITSDGVTEEVLRRMGVEASRSGMVKQAMMRRLHERRRTQPDDFAAIPGARAFLRGLMGQRDIAVAIATGCWREEAMFKLEASDIDASAIVMSCSEDGEQRTDIMRHACSQALAATGRDRFERVVYLGDGLWDWRASCELGFDFVGIGDRIAALREAGAAHCHADFSDAAAVRASLRIS
ncbi:HAD family hydrolase [Chromobacterium paludis]|nr:HAD hydrolase-like protein [Chromobacterium paludis]